MAEVTRVSTVTVRMVFSHITAPRTKEGQAARYEACFLIPKDSNALEELKAAYDEAARIGKARHGSSFKAKPFDEAVKDGDAKDAEVLEKCPYFKGHRLLNAHSMFRPKLQASNGDVLSEDTTEFYDGVYVRAKLIAAPFITPDRSNKGVTWFLTTVQKVRDGEALGGGTDAEFPPVNDDYDPNA